MSPRSIRRAAERKQRKLERKQARLAVTPNAAPIDDEFSPELIQEAQAVRERIATRNRANAAHSTGPVTPEGKLASSRNSLKHGLASGQLITPGEAHSAFVARCARLGEDPAAFESLLQDLLDDHQPANTTEELLVHEIAQAHWLMQRALRLQSECFTPAGIDEKRLALFLRYHSTHERAFHKALSTLLKLKRSRDRQGAVATRGFVSQHSRKSLDSGFVSQSATPLLHDNGFVSQSAPYPQPVSPPRTAKVA
ncbi:MAG TPA: hypothetical protein VMF91_04895 [Bryobacteraceae bacterium]|nr:hypothetical protein [Bryobacteraceae bacterium]